MSFMSASVSLSVLFLLRFAFHFRFNSSFFCPLFVAGMFAPPPPPTIYHCYRGTVRKSSHFLLSASHLLQVIDKISTVLSKSTKVHPPPQINVFDNDIHTCASYLLCAKLCLLSKLYIAISIERKK